MAKYHHNNLRSVALDHSLPGGAGAGGRGGRHFKKLWSASLRRVLLDTLRCGGRHNHSTIESPTLEDPLVLQSDLPNLNPNNRLKTDLTIRTTCATPTTLRSELKRSNSNTKAASNAAATTTLRSDKLSDLLRVACEDVEEIDVQRKVEALEELKRVVQNLQEEENHPRVLEGAREVRRLTKDDSEARTTLALLGAIPPLVALLDAPPPYRDPPFQVAALYALLNLGIGNDA